MQATWANFQQMVMGCQGSFVKNQLLQNKISIDAETEFYDREKLIQLHKINFNVFDIVNEAINTVLSCSELD